MLHSTSPNCNNNQLITTRIKGIGVDIEYQGQDLLLYWSSVEKLRNKTNTWTNPILALVLVLINRITRKELLTTLGSYRIKTR